MEKLKLYVIVHKELSPEQKAVQGGHALAAFALQQELKYKQWGNQDLIYLESDEDTMKKVQIKMSIQDNIKFVTFQEPDLNYKTTAMAFVANRFNHSKVYKMAHSSNG